MSSKDLLKIELENSNNGLEDLLSFKSGNKKVSDGKQPTTCKMQPSSVLANVKQFLPLMKEANKKLETIPAEDRDIECISESDQKVIEMNLALFEHSSDNEDSESETDSSEDELYGEVTENNFKISKQKCRKPNIEEVDNNTEKG